MGTWARRAGWGRAVPTPVPKGRLRRRCTRGRRVGSGRRPGRRGPDQDGVVAAGRGQDPAARRPHRRPDRVGVQGDRITEAARRAMARPPPAHRRCGGARRGASSSSRSTRPDRRTTAPARDRTPPTRIRTLHRRRVRHGASYVVDAVRVVDVLVADDDLGDRGTTDGHGVLAHHPACEVAGRNRRLVVLGFVSALRFRFTIRHRRTHPCDHSTRRPTLVHSAASPVQGLMESRGRQVNSARPVRSSTPGSGVRRCRPGGRAARACSPPP